MRAEINIMLFLNDHIIRRIKGFSDSLPEDCSILDIGCGKGLYTALLSNNIRRVFGLDTVCQIEEIYAPSIKFVQGNAEHLCFLHHTFDCVISTDVIEHVEDAQFFVSEFFRILKPGGYFFLGTPNIDRLSNTFARILGRPVKYPRKMNPDNHSDCVHIREYTRDTLEKMIRNFSTNFEIVPLGLGMSGLTFPINIPQFNKYCTYHMVIGRK